MRLVLASRSPARARLLDQLGLDHEIAPADLDEDAFKRQINVPVRLAESLAHAKAARVARSHPDAIVIGSDQLAVLDGRILSKPFTAERAIAQLESLSGRTHALITALCLLHGETRYEHCDTTHLTMRALTRDAIERYVAADSPLQSVGAYRIEGVGSALFERVETEDPSAIMGLPLFALLRGLAKLGMSIP